MKVITKMELQPDMVLGEDILDQDRVIYLQEPPSLRRSLRN